MELINQESPPFIQKSMYNIFMWSFWKVLAKKSEIYDEFWFTSEENINIKVQFHLKLCITLKVPLVSEKFYMK